MSRRAATVFLVLAGLGLGGCQTVEPWQKGNQAKLAELTERDSLDKTMTAHIQFSREATTGGEGVGGGGCGCN